MKFNIRSVLQKYRTAFFVISMISFWALEFNYNLGYLIGIPVATFLFFVLIKKNLIVYDGYSVFIKVYSFITAIGICVNGNDVFLKNYGEKERVRLLLEKIVGNNSILFISIVSVSLMILSIYFVYILTEMFVAKLLTVFVKDENLKSSIKKYSVVYVILVAFLSLLTIIAFSHSDAFYGNGTQFKYDIIYTTDSQSLFSYNAYLSLAHSENDIRQPLFSVFSAPLLGWCYTLAIPFRSIAVRAALFQVTQIVLMVFANCLLGLLLDLKGWAHTLFVCIVSVTFPSMLFSIVIEQYIVVYLWLMILLYAIKKDCLNDFIAIGASGTLLTSGLFVLFGYYKKHRKLSDLIKHLIEFGMKFLCCMLLFCRFDVFYTMLYKLRLMKEYVEGVSLSTKLLQYTQFVKGCFIGIDSCINTTFSENISWQANSNIIVSYLGILVIILSVIGFVVSRDKLITRIAGVWVIFSSILLIFLGWGTAENGLILYSLYFGWGFYVLLFQFFSKILAFVRSTKIYLGSMGICCLMLIAINLSNIFRIITFATEYYPLL